MVLYINLLWKLTSKKDNQKFSYQCNIREEQEKPWPARKTVGRTNITFQSQLNSRVLLQKVARQVWWNFNDSKKLNSVSWHLKVSFSLNPYILLYHGVCYFFMRIMYNLNVYWASCAKSVGRITEWDNNMVLQF